MKKIISLFLMGILVFTLSACSAGTASPANIVPDSQPAATPGGDISTTTNTQLIPEIVSIPISVEYDSEDLDSDISGSISSIQLAGDSIIFEGSGATVNGNLITITSAGAYSVSGVLNDGQIIVDTQDKETVTLILDGANITCSTSAPIYVRNADKAIITLTDGTENFITDGDSYLLEDVGSGEPNAAIFSKDDLTINGNGSLTIHANYNHGIFSKDDLKITGGKITVNAVNDGIKGRNFVAIKDGVITINAGGDGIQSNNDVDAEKGYITIEGGVLNITAGLDGMQAQIRLSISSGQITLTTGGGSANSSTQQDWGNWGGQNIPNVTSDMESAKGLKAGVDITITGGVIQIDSSDDAIHSNDNITINGGDFLLASGDDGVHSDSTLTINGGNLRITKSYEGIESAAITINNGNLFILSSDDGINAAGGRDGSSINGRPGQNPFQMSGDYKLVVNGGYIVVDASGDGWDINGTIEMTGGVAIINGPTTNNNGALDFLGSFNISGGFLVAAGSSGMAQAPSASSTQYSVIHMFSSPLAAGTMVHMETKDGQEIFTFVPTKAYQSIVVSSPELNNGLTCLVYTGGSSTGTAVDGLYTGGVYTGGAQAASYTLSSVVTGAGALGGGFPGGQGGPGTRPTRP